MTAVTKNKGHAVTRNKGHAVTKNKGHAVTRNKGHAVTKNKGHAVTKAGVCNWRYDAQCSASLCFEAPGHVILAPSCKLRSQRACSHELPQEIGSKGVSAL